MKSPVARQEARRVNSQNSTSDAADGPRPILDLEEVLKTHWLKIFSPQDEKEIMLKIVETVFLWEQLFLLIVTGSRKRKATVAKDHLSLCFAS